MEALLRFIDGGQLGVRPRIVILLDEIERIVPTSLGKGGFEGFVDFFGYLRGIAQESRNLVVIVTGANPSIVEVSQFDGRDNPVFNFFGGIYLQLLEEQEVKSMVRQLGRGMGIGFDKPAQQHIFDLLGGHPYLTREFCSLLTKKKGERPASVKGSDIESFVDEYLRLESNGFQEIADRLARDYPKELDLCVDLAESEVPVPLSELVGDAASGQHIKHLRGYQLASVSDDGRVSLTMKLFRTWLLRWLGGDSHAE